MRIRRHSRRPQKPKHFAHNSNLRKNFRRFSKDWKGLRKKFQGSENFRFSFCRSRLFLLCCSFQRMSQKGGSDGCTSISQKFAAQSHKVFSAESFRRFLPVRRWFPLFRFTLNPGGAIEWNFRSKSCLNTVPPLSRLSGGKTCLVTRSHRFSLFSFPVMTDGATFTHRRTIRRFSSLFGSPVAAIRHFHRTIWPMKWTT